MKDNMTPETHISSTAKWCYIRGTWVRCNPLFRIPSPNNSPSGCGLTTMVLTTVRDASLAQVFDTEKARKRFCQMVDRIRSDWGYFFDRLLVRAAWE